MIVPWRMKTFVRGILQLLVVLMVMMIMVMMMVIMVMMIMLGSASARPNGIERTGKGVEAKLRLLVYILECSKRTRTCTRTRTGGKPKRREHHSRRISSGKRLNLSLQESKWRGERELS